VALRRGVPQPNSSADWKSCQDPTERLRAIISIQFNYIHVYLRENLTAQRTITKLARVHRAKIIKEQNTKYGSIKR
jgi:hypothetical protein